MADEGWLTCRQHWLTNSSFEDLVKDVDKTITSLYTTLKVKVPCQTWLSCLVSTLFNNGGLTETGLQ